MGVGMILEGGKKRKKKTKSKYNKMGGRKNKTRKKRGGASCKSKKDCPGDKMCLPGGTQNIEGGEGQCVPKEEFVSHMKARGQKKRDERAAAKEEEQPEVDLSSLPEEPVAEETPTDVPVTTEPEKTEEETPVPQVEESPEYKKAKKEAEEKLNELSPEQTKEAAKKALENIDTLLGEISNIEIMAPQEGAGKRKKRKKRKKTKR